MKTGRFFDAEEIYNKEQHLRCSHVKEIVKSPAHFYTAWKAPQEDNKAFDEGRATHSVLLEQTLDKFIKRPEGIDGRTKDGKARLEALASTGKTVIAADVFDSMYSRLDVFTKSSEAMAVYDGATVEECFYAFEPESKMYIKAKPDMYKGAVIGDLKTTSNMQWFEKDIVKYGYHIQAGFHSLVARLVTGVKVKEFVIVAQEKVAPYGIQVFSLTENDLDLLERRAISLLNRVSVCIQENCFPSYDDIKKSIVLPPFALSDSSAFEEVG